MNVGSSVITTDMNKERMLLCVLHRPMDAETHSIPPDTFK